MAGSDNKTSGVAERYASALFDLALSEKKLPAVEKDLKRFDDLLNGSEDLLRLSPAALARRLNELEGQMHEHAKNLEFEEAAALRDQITEIKQQTFVS